jgi:tRNA 2-thiouridine synthesizing protein E
VASEHDVDNDPLNLPALDSEGFLRNMADWTPDNAVLLARRESIALGDEHWEIIALLRLFYAAHQVAPANRALVALVKRELGADKGQSRYLMRLFGGSPAKLAAKVSGLPKPENCL